MIHKNLNVVPYQALFHNPLLQRAIIGRVGLYLIIIVARIIGMPLITIATIEIETISNQNDAIITITKTSDTMVMIDVLIRTEIIIPDGMKDMVAIEIDLLMIIIIEPLIHRQQLILYQFQPH